MSCNSSQTIFRGEIKFNAYKHTHVRSQTHIHPSIHTYIQKIGMAFAYTFIVFLGFVLKKTMIHALQFPYIEKTYLSFSFLALKFQNFPILFLDSFVIYSGSKKISIVLFFYYRNQLAFVFTYLQVKFRIKY